VGLSLSFTSIKSSLAKAIDNISGSVKPIAGVVVGGAVSGILGAGGTYIDKLKAKADANLAKARGDIPATTRAKLAGFFGGVPVEAVLILGALTVVTILILRKKK